MEVFKRAQGRKSGRPLIVRDLEKADSKWLKTYTHGKMNCVRNSEEFLLCEQVLVL